MGCIWLCLKYLALHSCLWLRSTGLASSLLLWSLTWKAEREHQSNHCCPIDAYRAKALPLFKICMGGLSRNCMTHVHTDLQQISTFLIASQTVTLYMSCAKIKSASGQMAPWAAHKGTGLAKGIHNPHHM